MFDALGRRVAVLAGGAEPGRFTWDATSVPPGVYFVRATSDTGITRTATITRVD